jgi:plastocyanin
MFDRFRTHSLVGFLSLAVPLVAGCGGSSDVAAADQPESSAKKGSQVVIDNFTFNPPRLTVRAGTRVTWVNRDDVPHTATSTRKPRVFDSRTLDSDEQFSHVFTKPGTYEYFCALHPKMTAKIIVTPR